ncbi:Peroxisome biogenesis factor 10-like [Homarus americanus]|uniref:RING-type E3 ubiquitin transferase n=1 Tax=Homarus americanus TaxID=6706 RepID=A0A8J5JEH4_HOMAM|nr:Peroxisome biogenesis factor 10-like [Homarus americanus]
MPFQQAGAAEVLRASQKDESFLDYLKSCISEIVQRSAVIRRLLSKLEDSARSGKLSTYLRPELKNVILQQMPTLRYSLTLLHRIHLATFYFTGAFYHISKRVTGIKYVLVREWLGDSSASKSFQVLGTVLLTHILLTTMYAVYTHLFVKPPPENTQPSAKCYVDSKKQCSLCLDERKYSCVTPCGHLFCWQCIQECLQTSQQCPLCRHPATPAQVVPLLNYD